MSTIYENCDSILESLTKIAEETVNLESEMEMIEMEELDLDHHIELHELNEVEGYEAYKELKSCLMRRREIKNDLNLARAIKDSGIFDVINALDKAKDYYDKEKLYTPRLRKDLFPEITGYVPRTELKVLGNINEPTIIEEVVEPKKEFKPVYAKKNKNIKRFMSLDDAVEFISKRNTHNSTDQELWEDLMRKKILNAIKHKTEFCGYRWTW